MESMRFYYTFLSLPEKKIYNKIAEGIRQCSTNISAAALPAQVKKIIPMVFLDNPQFFYVDTTHYSVISGLGCHIEMGYHKNREEIRSIEPRLQKIGARFLEEIQKKRMNNLMTVKYVHDFVIRNTSYSFDSLNRRQTYGDVSGITGVLLKKSAVCLGISMTVKWLLDLAGIPSAVVEGYAMELGGGPAAVYTGQAELTNHAWNLVCLNDAWQVMDATMDLGASSSGHIGYDYFMRSSRAMASCVQHLPLPVDCSRETGSYFVQNRTVFSKEETIEKYLRYCIQNKKKRIYFTLTGEAALLPDDRVRKIIHRNMPCAYTLRYNDKMKIYDMFLS